MPLPLAPTGGSGGGVELDLNELTCEVQFESPILDDETGAETGEWQYEGDDWAKIEPFAGQELFLAMQIKPMVTHRITVQWREGVKTNWRLIFEDRIFHFDRVIDVLEQKIKLEIIAKEKTQPTI